MDSFSKIKSRLTFHFLDNYNAVDVDSYIMLLYSSIRFVNSS